MKIIAALTMLCDHMACLCFGSKEYIQVYLFMRAIGRISFILFCYLIVQGFLSTKNIWHYFVRLLLFAIMSEIPFDLFFSRQFICWKKQNVLFTFLIGLLLMTAIQKIEDDYNRNIMMKAMVFIACSALAYLMKCDYDVFGISIILVLYIFRFQKIAQIEMLILMLLLQMNMESFAVLAIPFIYFYDSEKIEKRMPKYFFYSFYPGHLLILYLLATLLSV